MGPETRAVSPLHPPCSKGHSELTSKLLLTCPEALSSATHRARSSEIGLPEQTQFLPVFPTLFGVLSSELWSVIILHVLFVNLFWRRSQKHTVPSKRLEAAAQILSGQQKLKINMLPMLLSQGCAPWIPACKDLLFTGAFPLRRLSATTLLVPSGLSIHSGHLLKSRKLFQLHNFWQEQEILEKTSGSIIKIFSGTTVKSYICIFLSLLMNCTTL